LYTSLGFVPEKRLHRFYLNGKDAFRLVLPLGGAECPAAGALAATMPGNTELKRRPIALPPPPGTYDDDDDDDDNDASQSAASGRVPAPASPSSSADDEDYAEDTAKLVRLRRRVAALRTCRMITVWPADDEDRISGR
jgi:peptide alpha-N-acetyltransferase